jgi:hypothetical protein
MADKTFKIRAALDIKDAAADARKLRESLNGVSDAANKAGGGQSHGGGGGHGGHGGVPGVNSIVLRELFTNLGFRGLAGAAGSRALGQVVSAAPALGPLVGFGVSLIGLTTLVGSFARSIVGVIEASRELRKESQTVGLTSAEVEKLRFAGGATGSSGEALIGGVQRLRELQIKAQSGDELSQRQLGRSGVSASGNSVRELLALGERFRAGSVGYFQAAALVGTEVLPALANGASDAAKQFERLNEAAGPNAQVVLNSFADAVSSRWARLKHDLVRGLENATVNSLSILEFLGGPKQPTIGEDVKARQAKLEADRAEFVRQQRAEEAYRLRQENDRQEYADLQKKLPLQKQLQQLLEDRAKLLGFQSSVGGSNDLLSENIRRAVLGLNEQIDSTQQSILRTPAAAAPTSDALQRIGLFRGGIPVETVSISRAQLNELKVIARRLAELPGGIASRL